MQCANGRGKRDLQHAQWQDKEGNDAHTRTIPSVQGRGAGSMRDSPLGREGKQGTLRSPTIPQTPEA